MNEPGPCLLKTDTRGRISIISCPETALVSREIIERHIALHNAAIDLKAAKGRHNTKIASETLFNLLP